MINKDEIIISEQQLFDYMKCPALYYYKYIKKFKVPEKVTTHSLLTKVMKYFLIQIQNGQIPSLKEIQRRWDLAYAHHKDIIKEEKIVSGWQKLIKFVEWFSSEKILVADVNTPYSIDVQNVTIKGNIEQIITNGNRDKIELFYANFSDKDNDAVYKENNLKFTIDSYAFKTLFQDRESGILVFDTKKDQIYKTYRTEGDFAKLRADIWSIGNSIKNGYYYTRESFMCENCICNQYCKFFNIGI